MASRDDLRKAHSRDGREAPVSWADEHVDHAGTKPSRYGSHRDQDTGGNETPRDESGANPAARGTGTADFVRAATGALGFRREGLPRLLHQRGGQSSGSCEIWFDY